MSDDDELPPNQKTRLHQIDEAITSLRYHIANSARLNTETSPNCKCLNNIPQGESYVTFHGQQIRDLESIFVIAEGRVERQLKKLMRSPPKFAGINWAVLQEQEAKNITGVSKHVIEEIASKLTFLDVCKDTKYKIETVEALALTLARFHGQTTYVGLERMAGRPASVISKIVQYVVDSVVQKCGHLMDLELNPLLTEKKVKQYARAAQVRERATFMNGEVHFTDENSEPQDVATEGEENDEEDEPANAESSSSSKGKRHRRTSNSGNGPQGCSKRSRNEKHRDKSKDDQNSIDNKRSHIFCTIIPLRYPVRLSDLENPELYHDMLNMGSTHPRVPFLKYGVVVGPDGLFLGLIGGAPGKNSYKELLNKKNIGEVMKKFEYYNDENDDGSNKRSSKGKQKEPYYMYAGWMFEDVQAPKPFPQVFTVGEISRHKFSGKHYQDEFSLVPEESTSKYESPGFKCPQCQVGLLLNLDTPEGWNKQSINGWWYKGEKAHWVHERKCKDCQASLGEDPAAWALRYTGLDSVHYTLYQQHSQLQPDNNILFDLKRIDLDKHLKFIFLMQNFEWCIERHISPLGLKTPELGAYMQLAEEGNPKVVEAAQASTSDPELFYSKDWTIVNHRSGYAPLKNIHIGFKEKAKTSSRIDGILATVALRRPGFDRAPNS